ncbi:hypothetical protein [Diplocloster agilis]|uniref:hypothetical protein n=1 Tax=Diplocloster agilis TaxID=2850323 RepID=UPI000823441F|nr:MULTISPECIES: hypothetical protein [Lachnospiraceae]MBU9742417.1 hypothetical protein [Diplocloster agilis]MCU6733353.1 hypothetical protein [Suonthocola fibrivorans]SCI88460.1 Uncharacterised protein [uncultured Clostridium sp.]
MKKSVNKILIILFFICWLGGCGGKVDKPYEISSNGHILSYKDSKIDNYFKKDGYEIIQNDDNQIRCITITDSDAVTIDGISVGDNIEKLKNIRDLIPGDDPAFGFLFDDDKEVDRYKDAENIQDSWIWLIYYTKDDIINKIQIGDIKYMRELR